MQAIILDPANYLFEDYFTPLMINSSQVVLPNQETRQMATTTTTITDGNPTNSAI